MPGFPKALARTLHELPPGGPVVRPSPDQRTMNQATRADGSAHTLLTRTEDRAGPVGRGRSRSALFEWPPTRAAPDRCDGAVSRSCCVDVPLDSRAEQEFAAALIARSPEVVATVPGRAIRDAGGAATRSAAPSRIGATAPRRRATSRTCAAISSRPIVRRSASAPATSCCSRRRAKDAKRSRSCRRVLDEAARGVPFDEMAVFLRTPQQVSRAARARVRARRRAGLLRSRHAPPRSRRPRLRRAAVVRRRRLVGQALRRVSLARPGAAGSPTRRRRRRSVTPARRGVCRPEEQPRRRRSTPRDPGPSAAGARTSRFRRRGGGRRHACDRRGSGKS